MANLAIIPARGGSKRIPRKNIRPFLGKPVIAYSIQAALESGCFSEVMVSTDDDEIAGIARKYGASVPFMRSDATAGDHATTADVLLEVLRIYAAAEKRFEHACCLYPAAPFITAALLKTGLDALKSGGFDTLMPVVKFSFPIWRSFERSADGRVALIWPEHKNTRSQDLPEAWHDAGQFYWFRVDAFLQNKHMMTANTGSIILPEQQVQDIDEESDWEMAALKYKRLHTP